MNHLTGRQARNLLSGITPGPWMPFHDEWQDYDGGMCDRYGVLGGSDAIMEADTGLAGDHDHIANLTLAASAPALAETVAWLYEREPDGTGPECIVEWHTPQNSIVWTAPGGRVMVQRIEPGELTPAQTVDLARALLAAAEEARRG